MPRKNTNKIILPRTSAEQATKLHGETNDPGEKRKMQQVVERYNAAVGFGATNQGTQYAIIEMSTKF